MKKLYLLTLVLLFMLTSNAFATSDIVMSSKGDITIDSQFTGSWKNVDSLIVVADTAASTVITVTGQVVLDPGDILYIGFGNDSANQVSETDLTLHNNLDSAFFKYPKISKSGKIYMAFVAEYVFSDTAVAGVTDTFYINAASGGNSVWEQVELKDVVLKAITDEDQ